MKHHHSSKPLIGWKDMISVSTFGLCKPPPTKNKAYLEYLHVCTQYTIYGNIWNINIGSTPRYCFFSWGLFTLYQSSSSTAKASTQPGLKLGHSSVHSAGQEKPEDGCGCFWSVDFRRFHETPRNTSNRSSNKWNIHVIHFSSCISRV